MRCCAVEGWSSVAGRWSQGEVSRGKLWSKECGAQSRSLVDEEVLCIEFGVWSVAWWFVCRSCAPDDAGVADPPGLAVFDTTHTLTPPAVGGLLLGGRAKCWHLVRIAAQHSAAQRNPGLGLLVAVGSNWAGTCWMENRKTQEDVSLLQTRLACGRWEPKVGFKAGSEGRFEFRVRVEGECRAWVRRRWAGGLLGLGEEGQDSVVVAVLLLADGGH